MTHIVTKTIIIFFILFSTSLSQNYGKIYGIITDTETNETLSGALISMTDKSWDVTSDTSGFYILMPLPIGRYTISITCTGYQNLTIAEIQVISNEGSRIDIALTPGQSDSTDIVIQASEQWATESIPYNYSRITADDIQSLPVRGLQNYMELQPGVVIQDDQIHIRGGRSDETAYFVNGLSTTNPLDNSNAIYIIPEAIEQIRILPGIYSARYGGTNSGIVLTDLKRGTSDYQFTLKYQTDKFARAGEQFLDTYSYRDQIITATASGPIIDNLRFFAAVENRGIGDDVKRFSQGFTINDIEDLYSLWYYDEADSISVSFPNGFTPYNSRYSWVVNSVLNYDFNPFSIQMTLLYNWDKIYYNDTPILDIFNRRQQYLRKNKWLLAASLTHRLSNRLYYTIGISRFTDNAERFDDWFGNDWQAWDDSARVADFTNGDVEYRRRYTEPYDYDLNYFNFSRNGQTNENYLKTSCTYTDFQAKVVWQIKPNINLQGGFFWRRYKLRRFAVRQNYYMQRLDDPGFDEELLWQETDNVYGYDIQGRELDTGFDGPRQPVFAGSYVQSSWRTKNVTINAGLRLDYFDTDDRYLKDPLYEYIGEISYRRAIMQNAWQQKDAAILFSPRLGLTVQSSQHTQIFASLIRTAQPPALRFIYYGSHTINRQFGSGYYYLNPVGFDMNMISSRQAEIGIRHQLSSDTHFYLSGYYKNTTGQARVSTLFWKNPFSVWAGEMQEEKFFVISNGDESSTRGLEMRFGHNPTTGINAVISYTLSSAEGTGSNALSHYTTVYRSPTMYDTTVFAYAPLDYDVKHSFLLNISYYFSSRMGGVIFSNSSLSVLMRMSSGHPYTRVDTRYVPFLGEWSADYERDRRSNQPLEPVNSSTTPWKYNIDLYFEKSFKIASHTRAALFIRILNVFNIKNVINVYAISDAADSDGFLNPFERKRYSWFDEQFYELYEAINMKNGQSYWMATGKQLYGHPRQILFGLKLAY